MLCKSRAILEPVYLGMKYLRLITGDWSAEMDLPENCICMPSLVQNLLRRSKYTGNVFCWYSSWWRAYTAEGNTQGMYFACPHRCRAWSAGGNTRGMYFVCAEIAHGIGGGEE